MGQLYTQKLIKLTQCDDYARPGCEAHYHRVGNIIHQFAQLQYTQ